MGTNNNIARSVPLSSMDDGGCPGAPYHNLVGPAALLLRFNRLSSANFSFPKKLLGGPALPGKSAGQVVLKKSFWVPARPIWQIVQVLGVTTSTVNIRILDVPDRCRDSPATFLVPSVMKSGSPSAGQGATPSADGLRPMIQSQYRP
jgi:hypothetical protein